MQFLAFRGHLTNVSPFFRAMHLPGNLRLRRTWGCDQDFSLGFMVGFEQLLRQVGNWDLAERGGESGGWGVL